MIQKVKKHMQKRTHIMHCTRDAYAVSTVIFVKEVSPPAILLRIHTCIRGHLSSILIWRDQSMHTYNEYILVSHILITGVVCIVLYDMATAIRMITAIQPCCYGLHTTTPRSRVHVAAGDTIGSHKSRRPDAVSTIARADHGREVPAVLNTRPAEDT